MPLNALTETLGRKRAAHLLRRATFGANKANIDYYSSLTPAQAIQELFGTPLPDPVLPIDTETQTEWISGTAEANSGDDTLQEYLKRWMIGQYLANGIDPSIKPAYEAREKITFFLHTYFTTMQSKVDNSRALYFQNALFRLFALDKDDIDKEIINEDTGLPEPATLLLNIKELTKRICIDNAMLIFLDGSTNVRGSANENFAREMLELYTIGRGLEGNFPATGIEGDYYYFTEQDVQAGAQVLTGWDVDDTFQNIDPLTELPYGVIKGGNTATAHELDDSKKVFSSRFDDTAIITDVELMENGRATEESMLDEIDQMIEIIFSKEETAKHLCRRIYRYYVYYEVAPALDDTVISDMAQTLINNDFKLQYVLEELLQSEHFYEAMAGVEDDKFGGIIKSPLDLVLGTYEFLEFQLPDYSTQLEQFYDVTGDALNWMDSMGMAFYEPFEVAGYSAYHQYPVYNRNWISTNYLTQRYNFIRTLLSQMEGMPSVDVYNYVVANFDGIAPDVRNLIIELAGYMFTVAENLDFDVDGGELTKERMRYFMQAFLGFTDYQSESAMAEADWAAMYPDDANYLESGEFLKRLFNAMMQSPEYQLF